MSGFVDLSGQVFGRLTVVNRVPSVKGQGGVVWNVVCECGSTRKVLSNSLRSGNSKSCGCLVKDVQRGLRLTHGMSRTREYRTWYHMWDRCTNKNNASYSRYGGRGVSVDPEWQDLQRFIADMGNHPGGGLTLERVNNDLGYSAENCVWASSQAQTDNRSITRRLTFRGVTKTIQAWARDAGLNYTTLIRRIDDWGWSLEKALELTVEDQRDSRNRNERGQYA